MQSKIIELSAAEKKVENFLEPLMKGLSSYKNQYKNPTFKEKLMVALRKCVKQVCLMTHLKKQYAFKY